MKWNEIRAIRAKRSNFSSLNTADSMFKMQHNILPVGLQTGMHTWATWSSSCSACMPRWPGEAFLPWWPGLALSSPSSQLLLQFSLRMENKFLKDNKVEPHYNEFGKKTVEGTVRAPVFGRHQFFGTSEYYRKAHGSLLSGWMNFITLYVAGFLHPAII